MICEFVVRLSGISGSPLRLCCCRPAARLGQAKRSHPARERECVPAVAVIPLELGAKGGGDDPSIHQRPARPFRLRPRSRAAGGCRASLRIWDARTAGATYPSPLSRPAGLRPNRAAAARRSVLGLLQIRFSAGLGHLAEGPRTARATGGAVSR